MPMKKLSTQCMNRRKDDLKKERVFRQSVPQKQTLDFLRQFARVYHTEPVLCTDLCSYVIN